MALITRRQFVPEAAFPMTECYDMVSHVPVTAYETLLVPCQTQYLAAFFEYLL
jgi:hypothetical protein